MPDSSAASAATASAATASAATAADGTDLRAAAAGELARRFPARWLEEHALLPLSMGIDGVATVASAGNPGSLIADALQRTLLAPVRFVNAGADEIRAALLATDRAARPGGGSEMDVAERTAEAVDDLRAEASREPVVQVVNAMFAEALQAGASDIHVESTTNGLRIRFRLDGVLRDAQTLGNQYRSSVISRLKIVAGLDIAERRLPQDGRARVRIGNREVDVRVSSLPSLHGESLVLRLLDHGVETRTLKTLGIAGDIQSRFESLLARSSGLVLVTGPTGSGKTTTLYAALSARSVPGIKVVTVEDPVEYRLEGITQLPVNTRAGFTFANALRAILRHDPDVILVGEMRDMETAEIAVQAALTGHVVLSTLHTTDAVSAITRLTEMGIAPYLVAATVQGVLAQRLVRTLCQHCATQREATATDRGLMRDESPNLRVPGAVGCDKCLNTGYQGRAAIAELVVLNDEMRASMIDGASLDQLRAIARTAGGRTLREDGWRLVREGRTTVEEIVRVVSEDEAR